MKNKISRIVLAITTWSIVFFMQVPLSLAAVYPTLQAYGVDTIAGYSTILRSSKTYPNAEMKFVVTKPDGTKVQINSVTDEAGVSKVELYDYHTRMSGRYGVSAGMRTDVSEGISSDFIVFPDEVSLDQSTITSGSGVVKADGRDELRVSVMVKDQYGNPFEGHVVKLISSRTADVIAESGSAVTTDATGKAVFMVTSVEPGLSVFSAVDSTNGMVLSARLQAAFLDVNTVIQDAGGDLSKYLPIVAAAESGPLHHFEISDIPDGVEPGQNLNLRVTALDSSDITVENYTGTVHFSSAGGEGNNVNMPEDYTFKAEDLGTHLFSLGLSFATAGTYTLSVTDIDNVSVKGELVVVVGAGGGQVTQQTGTKPTIVTPAPGSYSENVQTVSGIAEAGAQVKIYDNDQEIGEVQASSSGSYSFQTDTLSDGVHSIYSVVLATSGDVQGTSDTVEVMIDTTPPEVDDIVLDPTAGIKPGTVITVKLLSEENLSDAAVIFNSEIVSLVESTSEPGSYTAQIVAPENLGEYDMDIVLVDELNNEVTYQARATVNVSEEGGDVITPVIEETQEPEVPTQEAEPDNNPPTEVFGVIAYGTDDRVTLVWEAANDDKNVIHYRIYYGLDPVNMDQQVDTATAATTWYIPNLQNGKEYYFAVSAVDEEGLESPLLSQVVSAIPFTLEVSGVLPDEPPPPLGGIDNLHGASIEGNIPPEMSKNGPEALWLLGLTGLLSGLIKKGSKKKLIRR